MTPSEFLKFKLQRVCINELPARIPYKRKELDDMAQRARDEGRETFFYRPVAPNDWGGHVIECEPIYEYRCKDFTLTESEYKALFGEEE